jgi:superoxide reductase
MFKFFVCDVCGHIEFGAAPETCPVCFAAKEHFKEDANAIKPAEKEGKEKHVPVIVASKSCGLIPGVCQDIHIKVGSVPHPMTPEHLIQWIDIYLDHKFAARYMLTPQLQAAVSVHLKSEAKGTFTAIEHCNVHGTWMAETILA